MSTRLFSMILAMGLFFFGAKGTGLCEDTPKRFAFSDSIGTGETGATNGNKEQASFNRPLDLFWSWRSNETVFIVDTDNHCIRQYKDGMVSTFAGVCGDSGMDNGPANEARFSRPVAMCGWGPDKPLVTDMILIDETGQIRQIFKQDGQWQVKNVLQDSFLHFATDLTCSKDSRNQDETIWIADAGSHSLFVVYPITNSGVPFGPFPIGIGFGPGIHGFSDHEQDVSKLLMDTPTSIASYCPNINCVWHVAESRNGILRRFRQGDETDYVTSIVAGSRDPAIWREEGPAQSVRLGRLWRIRYSSFHSSYFLLEGNNPVVRMLGPDGNIRTVIGNGSIGDDPVDAQKDATTIRIGLPRAITIDENTGTIYLADNTNKIKIFTLIAE